jgi:hypothetical protein
MSAEKKAGRTVETNVSVSLAKKFKSHCKKLNVSMAQRLRDLMQKDVKS